MFGVFLAPVLQMSAGCYKIWYKYIVSQAEPRGLIFSVISVGQLRAKNVIIFCDCISTPVTHLDHKYLHVLGARKGNL